MRLWKLLFITLIFTLDLLLITKPVSTSNLNKSLLLPVLKIAIVNSYDIDHVCGSPQTQGIISQLTKWKNDYQFDIQVWYMKTGLTFTTPEEIEYISKKVIWDIKAFAPDYIFTVDDTAFKNIGIPFSKTHKIFFTGINKPILDYVNSDNIEISKYSGIEEYITLDKFFKMLSKIEVYPSKFWILSDSSTTSFFLADQYKEQIKKNTSFDVNVIVINTISGLRETLNKLQREKLGVIIYAFQTLTDTDYNVVKSKKSVLDDMFKYNRKHLELCENFYYSQKGIAMTISPDFYKMGSDTAILFQEALLNNNWESKILSSQTKFSINIKRLEELNFGWIYSKIIEEVDGSYAVY